MTKQGRHQLQVHFFNSAEQGSLTSARYKSETSSNKALEIPSNAWFVNVFNFVKQWIYVFSICFSQLTLLILVKPVLSNNSKEDKNGYQDRLSLNAGQKYCRMPPREHSAKRSTCIKLPSVVYTFVLSIFELPLIIMRQVLLYILDLYHTLSSVFVYHTTLSLGVKMTPCNKTDKPLVIYRFSGNIITSITTLRTKWQNYNVFTQERF